MVTFFKKVAVLLLAYCVGSFPTGYFFARIFSGIDLRNFGSGTAGASNTARAVGPIGFFVVFLIDLGKAYGFLAAYSVFFQDESIMGLFIAAGLVLGNVFSHGPSYPRGKGVSTALGALLFFNVHLFFIFVAVWLAILFFCKVPTCASLISSSVTLASSFFLAANYQTKLFLIVLQPILFYTHRVILQKFLSYERVVCYLRQLLKHLRLLKK